MVCLLKCTFAIVIILFYFRFLSVYLLEKIPFLTGLIQFQTSPITQAMIRPALEAAHITVQEEAGIISLQVVRAQGLLGRVLVAYRTSPVTAIDSKDYEVIHFSIFLELINLLPLLY